jgi:hypothetical protein
MVKMFLSLDDRFYKVRIIETYLCRCLNDWRIQCAIFLSHMDHAMIFGLVLKHHYMRDLQHFYFFVCQIYAVVCVLLWGHTIFWAIKRCEINLARLQFARVRQPAEPSNLRSGFPLRNGSAEVGQAAISTEQIERLVLRWGKISSTQWCTPVRN